ncbi:hypothetical protein VCR4J2_750294 [Vibrio coralliirubri]|nr:hypothetical protein VCR4J2_750294 [Vibrio coralliirubri]
MSQPPTLGTEHTMLRSTSKLRFPYRTTKSRTMGISSPNRDAMYSM